MDWLKCAVGGLALLAMASAAYAGPMEDLSATLQGRKGSASEDGRHSETKLRVFGHDIKGGCKGDVQTADLVITAATGHLSGDTAAMDVTYDGEYVSSPCEKSGTVKKHIYGHYLFHVTDKPFQKPVIAWGDLAPGIGEVADRDDVSNRQAVDAVKNAIASAF